MASNRRPDGGAGLARAFKAALVVAMLAAAGIGYVRQTMDQDRLGRLVTEQENRRRELTEEHRRLLAYRSQLTAPEAVEKRVLQFRLNLAAATPQQRLFVVVPASLVGFSTVPLGTQPKSRKREPSWRPNLPIPLPASLAQTEK